LAPLAGPQAVLGPQVSPSALVTAPVLAPAPALSAPAVLPPATQAKEDAETTLETVQGRPNRLGLRIDEARKLWAAPQDRTTDVSVAAYSPAVAQVSLNVESQLAAMAAIPGNENDPLFAMISRNAHGFLKTIDQHIKSGAIDPGISIRTSASDSAKPVAGRQLRVGIYAVSGDPLHWAHLLIGLQAIAQLKLDKVVFVVAGDDARKPNMTPAAVRHPMDREVLEAFRPFFGYSSIAVGTDLDGETNLFRILALNPDQKMRVYSIGGDDHYRLKDKNGNDDTIPKVEKNMSRPELRFNPAVHQVGLAFIEREGRAEEVPTVLEVQFLPKIEFEASSTAVRKHGRYALMPYSAYDYVKRHKLGLYGIPAD
jgi:nicotinic acid mononucleotide adenylyltransferase